MNKTEEARERPRAGRKPAPGSTIQAVDTALPAFAVTAALHALLFSAASGWGILESGIREKSAPEPLRHVVTSKAEAERIPAELLPAQMRPAPPKFVEVNPMAPSRKPDSTKNFGAADQKAAEPAPDLLKKHDRPRTEGEDTASTRVFQGVPRALLPKELRPEPGQPVGQPPAENPSEKPKTPANPAEKTSQTKEPKPASAKSENLPETVTKTEIGAPFSTLKNTEKTTGDGKNPETEKQRENKRATEVLRKPDASAPEGAEAPAKPRPKASLAGTSGPLAEQKNSSGSAGTLAPDSKFSRAGEYAQRVLESIQEYWWRTLRRSRLSATGTATITFVLHGDGSVTGSEITRQTTDSRAALICLDAINCGAPFGQWPEDMVAIFGESETFEITFIYR